jgi:hypothetical protein
MAHRGYKRGWRAAPGRWLRLLAATAIGPCVALAPARVLAATQPYIAVVLEPAPGLTWMVGTGAGGRQFAGYGAGPGEDFPGHAHAVLFDRSAAMEVTPPGTVGAIINDSEDGQHVGGATVNGGYPASAYLWNGTAPIDVHPSGAEVSELLGVGGGRQVGYVLREFFCPVCNRFVERHAGLWNGTAESFQLLHSTAHEFTLAAGTDGVQQVGDGLSFISGGTHALLWQGPATMAVDLHPAGAYDDSRAASVSQGQQGGSVWGDATGGYLHAALWTGTPESFRDLNPAGYCVSTVNRVRTRIQVGSGSPCSATERYRALAWRGTPAAVDLHRFLPPQFQSWDSSAEDVDAAGNIVGLIQLGDQFRPVIWYATRRSMP